MDSIEPLVSTVGVQVLDYYEPLVLLNSSPDEPVAGPSGTANLRTMASVVMPALSSSEDEEISGSLRPSGSSGRRHNPYSEEFKSMWNWRKIFTKLGTNDQCIKFAEDRGLLPKQRQCAYHRRNMSLSRLAGQMGKFCCYKSNCRTKSESRATGTWFENAKSVTVILQIKYVFSQGLSYNQTRTELASEDTPVLSSRTVADWFRYCRETVVVYELAKEENRPKIGGPGKIVQIDKSKCGKRKYNKRHQIEVHWVMGMIEDGSDDLRLEVYPDNERSAETLVPLIKKHIQEGSVIHTDYWRAYMSLLEHGTHKRVNHSDPTNKFVAPDRTHTQRIGSQWRGLQKAFKQQHNKYSFTDWLCEFSWRRRIRIHHLDPFEELIKAIHHVYGIQ